MSAPERIHTSRVLVVEGKYDAARLARLTDAMILPTGGFAIFSDRKRQRLLKELAAQNGLILLTDSDRAGFQIRTYITNLVGAEHVAQAYVPALPGKERRKAAPGKEGLLGVEGVPDEIVRQSLLDGSRTPLQLFQRGNLPRRADRQGVHSGHYRLARKEGPRQGRRQIQAPRRALLPPALLGRTLPHRPHG